MRALENWLRQFLHGGIWSVKVWILYPVYFFIPEFLLLVAALVVAFKWAVIVKLNGRSKQCRVDIDGGLIGVHVDLDNSGLTPILFKEIKRCVSLCISVKDLDNFFLMRCWEEFEEKGPVEHLRCDCFLDSTYGNVVELFGQSLQLNLLKFIKEVSDVFHDLLSHINTPAFLQRGRHVRISDILSYVIDIRISIRIILCSWLIFSECVYLKQTSTDL